LSGGQRLSVEQVADALRESRGLVSIAARRLGTSRANVYKYRDRHPAVRQALDDARDERVDLAESKLDEAIERGDPWAVSLTLRTIGRGRGYGDRVEHTGAGGQPIRVEFVTVLPSQEIEPAEEGSA
jgi:hypothetical protein